jgi:aspartate/methionine/tyrosine aminotransferase
MPQVIEQGPQDEPAGIIGPVEYIPQLPDESRTLRMEFADSYRHLLSSGEIANGIRPIALMAAECKRREIPVLNVSIGDIEWRLFPGHDATGLAEELGLDPLGGTYGRIREFTDRFQIGTRSPDSVSVWRYQPEAIGLLELRQEFAEFLAGYGFPYEAEHAVVAPGSLPGLDNVIGAVDFMARREGVRSQLIFPVPGFTVIESQAIRRGLEVVRVETDEYAGFLVTPDTLEKTLLAPTADRTMLYLTPMNNPTSTIYDPDMYEETVRTFTRLRPSGYILLDAAYLETVDDVKAAGIVHATMAQKLDRIITSVSMSKMFGAPGLRVAALYATEKQILHELMQQWQVVFASMPGPAQLDALARWKIVSRDARKHMYALFSKRQDLLIRELDRMNTRLTGRGEQPLVDLDRVYRSVPMYLYARLARGDFLDVFTESGILGVPGTVFGDDPGRNMVRFSTGIEQIL